jgi:integrase
VASILKVGAKWRALIRRKGHKSICKTFPTKAAAEQWARKIEGQIDAGKPVAEERSTVADLIDEYRRLRDKSRPIVDSSTEHYTLKQLKAGLGTRPVTRLTPQDLVGYCTMRRDEDGAGPYTCNMDISKLGTVLRYSGMVMGLPVSDVVAAARPLLKHLGLIGGGGRRERRPTADELTAIADWLAREKGELFAEIVRFAVATAMRQGEIERLQWADVDKAKRLVLVRDRKDPRNKKGNDQWVPLLGAAWTLLQRQPRVDGEPRIFPITGSTVSKYFTEACRKLSIPDLHFHDLRHEGTSQLFEEGFAIQQVALVTGHKDWRHLRRYTNLRPEDLHRGGDAKFEQKGRTE